MAKLGRLAVTFIVGGLVLGRSNAQEKLLETELT